MARGKSLEKLLLDLRAECGLSLDPAANEQVTPSHVLHLNRVQDTLWEDFNWPHLRVFRDVPVQAGQALYDPPAGLRLERVTEIHVRADGIWRPLGVGIDDGERTAYDPDYVNLPAPASFARGQRSWPPRRYMLAENDQFQVWPTPDRDGPGIGADPNDGILRFWGIRDLRPLVDATDRCELDARLIVLWTAAEILTRSGKPDATYKQNAAKKLQRQLQGRLTPRRRWGMFDYGGAYAADPRGSVQRYVRPRN